MTTLICDFQSIVGKKINGTATLTSGRVRPAYSAPSVIVHDPVDKLVVDGRATFTNVNPGEAVITVDWEDQSATLRFEVPESDEDIYLSDCLTGDYFTPEEIDLLRWGIKEQISGARELIETAANAGKSEITESISDYFSQAAETIRQTVEAAERSEDALNQIHEKVGAVEGTITTVDELQGLTADALARLQTLQNQLGTTDADLVDVVRELDDITLAIHDAAAQSALAVQEAQSAASELLNLQEATSTENARLNDEIEAANQEISQAMTDLAGLNTRIGNEVSGILEEVSRAMDQANQGVEDARAANDFLHSMQIQMGSIQDDQYEIYTQQQTILSEFDARMAEIDAVQTDLDNATSNLSSLTESHSQLTQDMTSKVTALQTLTQTHSGELVTAKQRADKGVADAAAASSALSAYKKVNDPKVVAAQSTADTARAEAVSKANAARVAAEQAAKELADQAQADAEVAAAAEALRIAQEEAQAAKDAAAADATQKANAARTAAENLAKAEAKAAKEAAEATAAADASTKANKAKTDAEAKAATLATAAQNAAASALSTYKGQNDPKVSKAQTDATSGITKADAAKKQADKGVADAATALARANEANNKLPAITSDVSAAAQTALDAVNALPGIRTDISTAKARADKGVTDAATAKSAADAAKKQADKGVADAKAVADQIPSINTKITNLTKDQSTLGAKAQQGIDEAKVAAELVKNRVDVGTSLVGLIPGTTRPAWSMGMEPAPESENPLGLADAYVARSGEVGNHEYVSVSASDKVKYRVSFWLKASEPGSDLVFDARSPFSVGGNTLAFAGNEAVEGALNPGDAGRVFWVRNVPTEWTYYEGIKTPAQGLKRFYIGTRYWRHNGGSNRTADQYVADLRIEPVIPSQDAVNKLLIDTAQNHSDILKAQGDINTAQGEINANNQAFQTWQKTINDQQKKWNDASTNATAALARFAITQSQWNTLSSTATNANTKAIASHAALFEGQNKWNEVATAAIAAQATLLAKQDLWNAAQEEVNDKQRRWNDAAKEILDSTGKFQALQTQFNSDQKKWNATQALVNDSQKGINALNNKTDDAQNQAIDANTRALNALTSNGTLIEYWQPTDAEIKANRLNPTANPLRWDRPVWTYGTRTQITATNDPDGFGLPPGQTEAWGVTSSQGNTVPPSVEAKLISDGKYLLSFWAKGSGGLVVYLYGKAGGESTRPVVRTRQVRVNQSTLKEVRDSNGARQYDGTGNGNDSESSGTQRLLYRFTFPAEWTYYLYEVEFKPGISSVYFNTFYWNYGTKSTKGQYLSGMEFRPDIPSQAQVDDAQNKAIQALNRFSINQSEWNTVSTTATNANTAAIAAKAALDTYQSKWIQGADLAIANLQTSSTKFKQWTKAATDATNALKDASAAQTNAIDALQRAVGLERLGQSLLTWNYAENRPNWATGMGNHYTSIPGNETVTYGITSSFKTMTTPGEFVPIIPNTPYRVKMWLHGSAGSVFVLAVTSPDGEPNPLAGGTFSLRGSSNIYLVNYLSMPTTWTLYEGTVEFAPGVTAVKIGTRFFNHSSGTAGNQYISGFEFYPDIPSQAEVDEAQNNALDALKIVVGDPIEGQSSSLTGQIHTLGQELDHRLRDVGQELQGLSKNRWFVHYWSVTGGNWHGSDWFEVTANSNGDAVITAKGTWIGVATVTANRKVESRYEPYQWWWNVDQNRTYTLPSDSGSSNHVQSLIINFRIEPGVAVNQPYSLTNWSPDKGDWRTLWSHTMPATAKVEADFHVGWDATTFGDSYGIQIVIAGEPVAADGPRTGVGPRTILGNGYRTMEVSTKGVTASAGQTIQFQVLAAGGTAAVRKIRDARASVRYRY